MSVQLGMIVWTRTIQFFVKARDQRTDERYIIYRICYTLLDDIRQSTEPYVDGTYADGESVSCLKCEAGIGFKQLMVETICFICHRLKVIFVLME